MLELLELILLCGQSALNGDRVLALTLRMLKHEGVLSLVISISCDAPSKVAQKFDAVANSF